ncbi:hypothetical protein [Marinibactrum halimedae]|uniref:Uncharacterized protein n=1 Tax=Marinibactrum halimedae TaxID=1444977 RepID=A0AA37TB72_9GAMM|nr:hypothetical protein [Marinibactrum halimedae]MCD9459989.1 hypothetical protein [Marinibactrum halimedae]GLS28243.1 hypothetical protein GCM10007877_39620 [Marinibactrum halimedae]
MKDNTQHTSQTLEQQIQALNQKDQEGIQPERDLWPGIAFALTEEKRNHHALSALKPWLAGSIAASCFAVMMAGWVFIQSPTTDKATDKKLVENTVLENDIQNKTDNKSLHTPRQQGFMTAADVAATLRQQHTEYKRQLLSYVQSQTALTTDWQTQLKDLEEAATAIEKALQDQPNNVTLLNMLQQVHHQQLELIERVHQPTWTST